MAEVRPIKLLDVGSGAGQLKEFEDGDAVPDSSRLGGQLPSHYATQSDLAGVTPGPEFYKRSNILGTASQSGGVPTGAIIERGSNANGEYIRWADGTQICTKILTVSLAIDIVFGSMYASAAIQLGTPAASFINTPAVSPTGWDATGNSLLTFTNTAPTASNLGVLYLGRPSSQGALNRHVHVTATGRWF